MEKMACTLPAHEYSERMTWIANLNRQCLQSVDRTSRTLTLRYTSQSLPQVQELVKRETACCGFLDFTVDAAPTSVTLLIVSPADAEAAAQPLFDQFSARIPTGDGCACSTRPPSNPTSPDRAARVAVKTSAVAALACGVCCVVPFVFPAVALTTFGAGVAAVAGVYWWAMRLAILAIVAGWLWLLIDALRRGQRPGRATFLAMASASLFVLLAFSWSRVEPHVIAWLKQS